MITKHILKLLFLFVIFSCSTTKIVKIEGKRLNIDEELTTNQDIENFIKPYREKVNRDLDSVISYAPETYSKSDGELNTAIGNLMADAVYSEGNPLFKKQTDNTIDFVLLNHGGIRAIISKGDVTSRTAYEVMPFENSVVVVALKGIQINKLFKYLSKAKRAHPLSSQVQLSLDSEFKIISATVNGQPINEEKIYYIATNDYLYNGGDRMTFFHPNEGMHVLNYKIRNVLIDYFKKTDTLNPKIDNRFTKLND
ncbi:5'-nucleotidase C-terminal domain-containing protein [Winogradskyella sp. PG-2]|uniref:5'-nucleotidase C-terminal domain-containing protein n=1 Tax=Winogradskyella sp. PG-2 TaxID=754409 RepID=UPI0004588B75|nr:5'-nucleotidase [Winogradskyella sp. PG-2]BAO77743.1 5'-nucleotidase [Winogradskyella sp. PG-2]